mmetsp:Transcript_19512/g.60261  ORF Transcript_19512/g.60261 Transcript_19512/m.60261 type:complete len:182 (-) Transcript_19512:1691-2236(-)
MFGDEKSADITWAAVTTGAWRALPVFVASAGGVFWANHSNFMGFRGLGPSGKVALAIAPPLAAWSYFSEVGVGHAIKGDAPTTGQDLPFKLRALNYFYENTLSAYMCLVTPCYAAVLAGELRKPRGPQWRLSHAIIHTRVIGQAIAVGGLVVVFGGREVLKRNGAPYGRVAEEMPWLQHQK